MIGLQPPRNGPKRPELMELLESCHGRMRDFMALAFRLASAPPGTPSEQVVDAARSIQRYFEVSFPLHGIDEEKSLIPRLLALDPTFDASLARIEPDHRELDTVVATVCRLCATIAATPAALDGPLREELAAAAADLGVRLSDHLAHEEATLFPAIEERLVPTQSEKILTEIRARRST